MDFTMKVVVKSLADLAIFNPDRAEITRQGAQCRASWEIPSKDWSRAEDALAAHAERMWDLATSGDAVSSVRTIGVKFSGVKCLSVCDIIAGHLHKVLMVNPSDPIRSKLFHFYLQVDLCSESTRSISVYVQPPQLTSQFGDMFLRLIRICVREFSQEKQVYFQSRKHIGRAKRRYVLWLGQNMPELTQATQKLYLAYEAERAHLHQTVGTYDDAKSKWEAVVRVEQAFTELS